MGEHQKLSCQNVDRRKPMPGGSQYRPAQVVQPPQSQPEHPNFYPECPIGYHRVHPVQASSNPAHQQENQNEGTSSLTIYRAVASPKLLRGMRSNLVDVRGLKGTF